MIPKPKKKAKKARKFTKTDEKKLIKKLTRECKTLCSQICRLMWDGKCAVCGKPGTAAHHFFGWKACSAVRFTADNLIWLCYYDHIGKIHQQGLTEPARVELIRRIGQERFNSLYERAFKPMFYTSDDLMIIKDRLEEILKILEKEKHGI